jgi:hypothetical protein
MSEFVKVRYHVSTNRQGSLCEDVCEFPKDEWESMSPEEQEQAVRDEMFNYISWGYEVVSPDWYSMPRFGCAVRVEDGVLLEVPMLVNGNFDYDSEGEVTAPDSQEFLDAVNEALGTDYTMGQFAGR